MFKRPARDASEHERLEQLSVLEALSLIQVLDLDCLLFCAELLVVQRRGSDLSAYRCKKHALETYAL